MKQPGYGAEIVRIVKACPYEQLILTDEIAEHIAEHFVIPQKQAKSLTNNNLKRMADRGEIRRLQKGMYCHVKETVFGKVVPDIDKIMVRNLTQKEELRIGYESGASLLNRLGLSTLLPREIEITTNAYAKPLPEKCHIKVKKPPVSVDESNWRYLQFVDIVMNMMIGHTDAEDPAGVLRQFAEKQQLNRLQLIFTARRYYPAKAVLHLTDVLMEV